jgi:hypothetical protein
MKLRRAIAIALSSALVLLALSAAAPAAGPTPPINDDYLFSLELNSQGRPLNSTDTLKDVRNTTAATVQSNIFDPPHPNLLGPAELTNCHGTSYGKTVWYDFYPNANGIARIRASGFDNVVTLYPFNVPTALPDVARKRCVHQSSFPSEELDAPVSKGRAYTIQIGGAGAAGGPLQMLFDFFITPPRRLNPSTTLKARATSNGIQLLDLAVATSRAAHVSVSCGRFCRNQSKFGEAVEHFPKLKNVKMPAGSKLQIRVTARHSIGALVQYNILPGNFTKIIRCTEPGSRKPRRSCH